MASLFFNILPIYTAQTKHSVRYAKLGLVKRWSLSNHLKYLAWVSGIGQCLLT